MARPESDGGTGSREREPVKTRRVEFQSLNKISMEIMDNARSSVQGEPNANIREDLHERNACASSIIVDTESEIALNRDDSKNWFD